MALPRLLGAAGLGKNAPNRVGRIREAPCRGWVWTGPCNRRTTIQCRQDHSVRKEMFDSDVLVVSPEVVERILLIPRKTLFQYRGRDIIGSKVGRLYVISRLERGKTTTSKGYRI